MIKKLLSGALALMALVACSKEQDAPVVETPKTKTVRIQLSAGRDEESARALFGIKDDGSGATTGLEMPEKDVLLRIAVRQGTGTPVYQTIQFKKTPGRNHATYTGDITVPVGGSGDYKIAAVHLSDVGGEVYATVAGPDDAYALYKPGETLVMKDSQGKLSANIPYTTKWQSLVVSPKGTAEPVKLLLSPVGTLLRMRIKNESVTAQNFTSVRVSSTAFGYGGFFTFTEVYENGPLFRPHNRAIVFYNLPNPITVAPNDYSDWLYAWVYPRAGLLEQPSSSFVLGSGAQYSSVFETKQHLSAGSVPLTLVYRGGHEASFASLPETSAEFGQEVGVPKLSLEYMAEAPLDATGTNFVTGGNEPGLFSFEQVQQFKAVRAINGKNYSLPTASELKSILPSLVGVSHGRVVLSEGGLDVLERGIKIGNVIQDYLADYVYDASTATSYAVRFKNSSNYNRTAFRFTQRKRMNGLIVLTIDAVYLGTTANDITTISTDNFWSANSAKIITRDIPLYGAESYDVESGLMSSSKGKAFVVWSSTPLDASTAYAALFTYDGYSHVTIPATHDKLGVIPFVRE